MGGTNPYIEKAEYDLPQTAYTVTYIQPDGTVTKVAVDPARIPYGPTGLPGSLLDIAMGNGVDLEHVCGGVCACSTCHVMVKQGLDTCNEGTDDEYDQLDEAPMTTVCAQRHQRHRCRDPGRQQKPCPRRTLKRALSIMRQSSFVSNPTI
jgi:2Fe-2S ferredoxin